MLPRRGGLLERVAREEWNIGVIGQSASDIVKRGIIRPVRWLPPLDPWHGFADPAVQINPDKSITLFAERTNYWQGRGSLWAAKVAADADLTTAVFQPFARAHSHLSYPFPFTVAQNRFLTMEHAESGQLHLYRRGRDGWSQSLLLDRPAVDPTILRWKDSWWLFCTFADDSPDQNLHVFFADTLSGPWTAHPLNPVKTDQASSRPAGPLFISEDRLIRPSQDCTQSYGGALVLNAVTQLDRDNFREQPIRRLSPIPDYPDGLHTLCPVGDHHTLIDGKRWSFRAIDPLRYLLVGLRNRYRKFHKSSTVSFTPL